MTGGRRKRGLSPEDAWLWGEVSRLVTPLEPGRERPAGKPVPTMAQAIAEMASAETARAQAEPPKAPRKRPPEEVVRRPATMPPYQAPPQLPKGPATMEKRTWKGLSRGSIRIEARIDLHGLFQADAHAALIGFIRRAHGSGLTHLLVVTGKGRPDAENHGVSERGVIRRSVPHWLRSPGLSPLVLGFEEAGRAHGGAGALYIRLRRR